MATFLPLESLRKIVDSARGDLKQLRDIDSKLRAKITTVSNRQQFAPEYIRQESVKLRTDAIDVARGYLASENPLAGLASVKSQGDAWTVAGYLAHAANDLSTNDTNSLLRRMILTSTLPRMTTAAVADLAQSAVDRQDWATVGVIHAEAAYRNKQGDDPTALALEAGILSVQIPALAEAQELMGEAHRLEEWITYATRSIETGQEDIGIKHEGYAQEWAERQAAKSAA